MQHQTNTCMKMGSDVSHFNCFLILRDKATGQCSQTPALEGRDDSRSGVDPSSCAYHPKAFPLEGSEAGPSGRGTSTGRVPGDGVG